MINRSLLSEEMINLRRNTTFYSQLSIRIKITSVMMIYALPPQLKFYTPAWSTPSILKIFSTPPALQISEKSYPQLNLGGEG